MNARKGKLATRKSWREKLEKKQEPKVFPMDGKFAERYGPGSMLVPTPLLVDGEIRKVPRGKLITQLQLRQRLARAHKADVTCPITTGIFIRIAVEAAEEDRAKGRADITPWWRVIRDDGSLSEKVPGGTAAHAKHLRAEGHAIEPSPGKKPPKVKDFEPALVKTDLRSPAAKLCAM